MISEEFNFGKYFAASHTFHKWKLKNGDIWYMA